MPAIKAGNTTRPPALLNDQDGAGLFSSLVGVARQKLGQKQPSWVYDERASLLLPAWFLGGEQDGEARTIEDSLKPDLLRAVVGITRGNGT